MPTANVTPDARDYWPLIERVVMLDEQGGIHAERFLSERRHQIFRSQFALTLVCARARARTTRLLNTHAMRATAFIAHSARDDARRMQDVIRQHVAMPPSSAPDDISAEMLLSPYFRHFFSVT